MNSQLGTSERRLCTVCGLQGKQAEATHVAGDGNGFGWFECGAHGPNDHPMAETRTSLVTLTDYERALERQVTKEWQVQTTAQHYLGKRIPRAKAALEELRRVAGPPGKRRPQEQDEPDIRQWPVPSCLTFPRWRALLHRASGISQEQLRKWLVDIMRSCDVTSQELKATDIADHWSEQTCPSIKAAHYAMTKVCDKEGLPIPYFEGQEGGLPW